MMVIVDYLNVITNGGLQRLLQRGKRRQYVGSAFLGATPGCLGAFAVVSLYIHRMLSLGALTGCMLATSGDESFVMLALFPRVAVYIFAFLFVLGIFWGWIADLVARRFNMTECEGCELHILHVEQIKRPSLGLLRKNLASLSLARCCMIIIVAGFAYLVISGAMAHDESGWITWTMLGLLAAAGFITLSVPEHYLKEHLWNHLAKKHLWRIALWVTGMMLMIHYLAEYWDIERAVKEHTAWIMPAAVLMGFIPESGPHLIFAIMYSNGLLPVSILVASCIAQDGHGMLPLLSVSVKDFVRVKVFKIVAAFIVGYFMFFMGW
jgi:hypothetical protein